MDAVFQWITTYGYGMMFLLLMLGIVGLPVPDETLLIFCGVLISRGQMRPLPAWLCAVGGSWCGISLSYIIGRTFGLGVVHRYGKYLHITQDRLDRVHLWFERIGHWALFVGYYIAGLRHFTAIVAGTSRLPFRHFIAYAWSGGLLWVTTFLAVGYVVGENWQRIAESIHHYVLYASVAILLAAAGYFLIKKKRRPKQ
jgi:membrane protein DedA with SNARE-associated domain